MHELTTVTDSAAAQLQQVQDLVALLDDAQYVRRPPGASSVAGHVRHCVDHYAALLAGAERGTVDYDRRERGGALETDRTLALARLDVVRSRVRALAPGVLDRPVEVSGIVDARGTVARSRSTVGRELLFVAHHAVHHLALMMPVVRTLGVSVPADLGYAPATMAFLRQRDGGTPA